MWPVEQREFSLLPLRGVVNGVYSLTKAFLAGVRHFYQVVGNMGSSPRNDWDDLAGVKNQIE